MAVLLDEKCIYKWMIWGLILGNHHVAKWSYMGHTLQESFESERSFGSELARIPWRKEFSSSCNPRSYKKWIGDGINEWDGSIRLVRCLREMDIHWCMGLRRVLTHPQVFCMHLKTPPHFHVEPKHRAQLGRWATRPFQRLQLRAVTGFGGQGLGAKCNLHQPMSVRWQAVFVSLSPSTTATRSI